MNATNSDQLIISSESPYLYSSKRLDEEAQKLGFITSHQNPYQIGLALSGKHLESNLKFDSKKVLLHRTTGVRYDDHDLMVSKIYENKNYKIINSLSALKIFRNKDEQQVFFNQNKIPSIPSYSYRGQLNEKVLMDIKNLSESEKYVVKMNRGNQGIGVNIINGFLSLKTILETFHALKDQKFIIQPFIEHQIEQRVFFIKNEIHAVVEKKINSDDFRANSRNSSGKFCNKMDSQTEEILLKAIAASGLDYGGIDLFIDHEKCYFFEINAVAGFKHIEELASKNLAKEILLNLI